MSGLMGWISKKVTEGAAAVGAGAASEPAQVIPIGNKRVKVLKQLGEGGYAFVYAVEDVDSGQTYALKRMICQDETAVKLADKEIRLMKRFNDPNIVQFYGACRRDLPKGVKEYFILMEYCSGGHLLGAIMKRNGARLPEPTVAAIFLAVCKAIKHLHTQKPKPIAHRDLKLENILLTPEGEYKLCDFGSCTTRAQVYSTKEEIAHEEERVSKFTTAMYRAPEMVDLFTKQLVNEKVDIWALGCILFTVAFFEHPFQQAGNLGIINGKYDVPEDNRFSKYLTALIRKLLTTEVKRRPNIHRTLELIDEWQVYLKTGKPPSGTVGVFSPTKLPKAAKPPGAAASPAAKPRAVGAVGAAAAAAGAGADAKASKPVGPGIAAAAATNTPVASGWAEDDWDAFGSAAPAVASAGSALPPPSAAGNKPTASAAAAPASSAGGKVTGEITQLFGSLQWASDAKKGAAAGKGAGAGAPPPPGAGNLSPDLKSAPAGPSPPSPIASPRRADKAARTKATAAPVTAAPAAADDGWAEFNDAGPATTTTATAASESDWDAFVDQARGSAPAPGAGAAAAKKKPALKELKVSTKPVAPPSTPANTPLPLQSPLSAPAHGSGALSARGHLSVPLGLRAVAEDTPPPPREASSPNPAAATAAAVLLEHTSLARHSSAPAHGGGAGPSRPASTPPTELHRGGSGAGSGAGTPKSATVSSSSAPAKPHHHSASSGGGSGSGTMDFGNILGRATPSDGDSSKPRPLTMAEQIAAKREEAKLAQALAGFGSPHTPASTTSDGSVDSLSSSASGSAANAHTFTVTGRSAVPVAGSGAGGAATRSAGAGMGGARVGGSGEMAFAFVQHEKHTLLSGSAGKPLNS